MPPENIENKEGEDAAKNQLKEFGLEWKNNALKIPGAQGDIALDENAKSVAFKMSEDKTTVTLIVTNVDGSVNQVDITADTIKIDGQEQLIPYDGKQLTFREICEEENKKTVERVKNTASNFFEKENAHWAIEGILVEFGDNGFAKKIGNNQIVINKSTRGGEPPLFEFSDGKFICVNYPKGYSPMNTKEFKELLKKIQITQQK